MTVPLFCAVVLLIAALYCAVRAVLTESRDQGWFFLTLAGVYLVGTVIELLLHVLVKRG